MKRNLSILFAATLIATGAQATVFGNTTNNQGGKADASAAAAAAASATGIGVGIGQGGSATATGGTASNRTDVSTTVRNEVGQHQGQLQGQLQGQQQAAISGGNKLTNEGNNSAQSTSVKVEGDTYQAAQIPVATAYAPMVNNTANCAIGVSGGIQAATWGISGGSAFESETCVTIEQAKVAKVVFNDVATGEELMCSLAKYREARKSAGRPCNADKKAAASPGAQQTAAYEPTDPIVRARIGLPPLSK